MKFYKRFLDNLVNHDKFEFQIMPGTIILDKNLSESIKNVLTKSQFLIYNKSLKLITNNIINLFPDYMRKYKNDVKK